MLLRAQSPRVSHLFVFLTTSQPFFGSQSFNDIEELFVHNATVTVSDDAGIQLRSTSYA